MDMKKFVKERDEALLSLDKGKILAYCKKYRVDLPKEERVFWAAVHKAILQITTITPDQRNRSEKWLIENGFRTSIF